MATKKTASHLSLGGIPRVNLLPSEVGERRAQQGRVRILVFLVVLAVLIVSGSYALTVVQSTATQAALADAQAQTQSLLQEQGTYSQASAVNDSISQVKEALKVTTSSEVLWADLYGIVNANLPAGARVTAAIFTGRAPFDGVLVPPSPLSPPKVAIIAATVSLASPDDAATFIQSLGTQDLVSGVTLVSIAGVSGQYLADFRVDFSVNALSQRFATDEVTK